MRKRVYEIIEVSKKGDKASYVYDAVMLTAIFTSLLPLAFKEAYYAFVVTDIITSVLFVADYFLRLATADYKLNSSGISAFLRYPFTPWAIVDLLSIIPSIGIFVGGLSFIRVLRVFRVFRVFKAFRYSKTMVTVVGVIKDSRDALVAVCTLALGYILTSALIIYNVEGDSFTSFFEAVYWATISLTTVGYGDIYPVTTAGRVITMLSSVFGIAIIALPSGIITAGYMKALNDADAEGDIEAFGKKGEKIDDL